MSQIEEVSIDRWIGYKNVAEKLMPQAQIVGDRFQVMKQVNNELDEARKAVKREAIKIKNQKNKEQKQHKMKIYFGFLKLHAYQNVKIRL